MSEYKKMGFDLPQMIRSLPPDVRELAQQRMEWVHTAQRQLGMEPRNDSILTYKYAIGELEDDDVPSAIAKELVFVDRLYKQTSYGRILEDVLRGIADHIRRKYKLSWTDTWDITRFYGATMLKLYCARTQMDVNAALQTE